MQGYRETEMLRGGGMNICVYEEREEEGGVSMWRGNGEVG